MIRQKKIIWLPLVESQKQTHQQEEQVGSGITEPACTVSIDKRNLDLKVTSLQQYLLGI